LEKTPGSLFGTLWIRAAGERIKSLHTIQEKSVERKDAISIKDMLSGNIGKNVKLNLYGDQFVEGKIISVIDDMVNVRAKDKWVSRSISSVTGIEFVEEPDYKYDSKMETNQLEIEFNSDGKKSIEMMYMQRGIGWFPNYLIEINDEKEATVTLKSTLINDIEDLVNAEIEFVVGVPNFKYNYVNCPLSSSISLESFISSLNGLSYTSRGFDNFANNNLSNAIMAQQVTNNDYERNPNENYELPEFTAEGSSEEDLYFYNYKNVTLKKGERANYELLNIKVPFEHVYEVILNPNTTNNYYYANSKGYSFDDNSNKVWHSIKLNNTSKMPWTTGTAMIVKKDNEGSKPISQDMLSYIPVGGKGYLKVTVSPDISVKDKEEEIKRVEKSKKKDNYYYDLVTVEGKIRAKNFKDTPIKLNVKRSITGELQESDVKWEFSKSINNYYYNNINPVNDVTWEIELKPGEEKEIKYSYTIFIYN